MADHTTSRLASAAAYACWRFDTWMKGYGSYTEIDDMVTRGELIPGRDYPEQCPSCYGSPSVSYCGRCGRGAVL